MLSTYWQFILLNVLLRRRNLKLLLVHYFFPFFEVPLFLESFADDHNQVIFHVSVYIFLTRDHEWCWVLTGRWIADCDLEPLANCATPS